MAQKMIRIDDDLYTELEKIKNALGGSVAYHAAIAIRKGLRGENSMLEEILSCVEDIKLMLEAPEEAEYDSGNYDLDRVEKIELPKTEAGKVEFHHTPPKKNSEAKASNISGRKTAGAQVAGQLPCCKSRTTMCKHWVWDSSTGEGYINKLDGELLEVTGE